MRTSGDDRMRVSGTLKIFLDEDEEDGFGVLLFRSGDLDFDSLRRITRAFARDNPLPIPVAIVVTGRGSNQEQR